MEELFKPSQIIRKPAFRRIKAEGHVGCSSERDFTWEDNVGYDYLTQADFIREFKVSGHRINDRKFYPDKMKQVTSEETNSNGEKEEVTRWVMQKMIRMALPEQAIITTKQLTAVTGNNISFSITDAEVTSDMEKVKDRFMQGWQEHDMEIAWYMAVRSLKITADVAFCGFKDKGRFDWHVFSYLNGDILFPRYDKFGRLEAFGRMYTVYNAETEKNETMLDVWDDAFTYTYRRDAEKAGNDEGWVLEEEPKRHGFSRIPIAYFRVDGPCWEDVQDLIEQLEMAFSQLAENNRAYALRILFTKGAAVVMQSTMDGTPVRIDTEEVDADAKYLEPADASGSFKMQIEALEDSIRRGSFTVKTPEVKGSDLSGLAVELLFTDSTQKAHCDAQEYKPFLNEMVRIFKEGYGTEAGITSDMERLHLFSEILPFLPKSETEEVSNIVQLKSVGALSQQTSSEQGTRLGYGKNAEYRRIMREERDKLISEEPQINVTNALS